jgi:hypothetical protein
MKRWVLLLLGMVLIFGALAAVAGTEPQAAKGPPVAPQGKAAAKVIWTGQSGGFAISWTAADIQARPLKKPGRLVFSAAQLSRRGFQTFISPPNLDGSEEQVTYERKFALLSVVGSIVSFRDELYYNVQPSAHPGLETRFTTIDLAKSGEVVYVSPPEADLFELDLAKLGKVAKLTDYFPNKEVLQALRNNAIIKEALGGESPSSLAKLFKLLQQQEIRINKVPFIFPRDFLTRFAFHHLQGGQVAVLLGLPSSGGAARGLHAELDLLLPVPPAWKKSLTLAASEKEGFLMQDQERLSRGEYTIMPFTKGKKPPGW